ncbi:terpene synthase family protein [Streptosporangium sp. NBC_01469]|uniref:terpene synthase family protein n=1 Tax=Streptosporangium sp. NBC_01469 TaxID=2903898 RepID=UPI002E2DF25B|nr:terpene synthase family protein [Streptosporangium sp. NBC_01469]
MARTEVHEPPHAVSPPARLTERLAALAMPCPVHPSAHLVEAATSDWARAAGLPPDPVASRLAGRAFARCETGSVTSLARWLTWMSHLRRAPEALTPVLAVATGGEPGPAPLERAFSGLWTACAPGMSGAWRERFTAGLAAQREAVLGRGAPLADDRAKPAGGAFGRYLLDLVEPCLGVEVPERVWRSPPWRALVEASGDVAARCEEAVAGHGQADTIFLERSKREAEEWTIDRVATRMEELWTAARAVPALTERHDLGLTPSREVTRVACAFLTIPRAYLEWLLETPRYRHLR